MKLMPVFRIMISCPSDIKKEVQIVKEAIAVINDTVGFQMGILAQSLYWSENVIPNAGKSPQEIINEQVLVKSDAVVAIFGNKIGSPTDQYESGTIEEIELTIESGKQVFVYFSNKPIKKEECDAKELREVEIFKRKYKSKGIYWMYETDEEFKELIRRHLEGYILRKITEEAYMYKKSEDIPKDFLPSKVYANITKAHQDIASDIRDGKIFKFYGLRGATFIGSVEVNEIVHVLKTKTELERKFLISYPFSDKVKDRLKSMEKFADEGKCEEKWRDTYNKVFDLINQYKDWERTEIRFHDTNLLFRLIFTKNSLYMGYYEPNKDSVDSEILRFGSDTVVYRVYEAFFENQWKNAKRSIPKDIPAKYSFLKERFSMAPSLVINTTSVCNMNCIYCPKGGENLCDISNEMLPTKNDIKRLVEAFEHHMRQDGEVSVLRITGGEPLLTGEGRQRVAEILDTAKHYNKIVLCTNGVFLREAYQNHKREWDAVKDVLLLKISLDTLDPAIFTFITGTGGNGEKLYQTVIDNILFAKENGFKIELNMVATKVNLKIADDVVRVFDFVRRNELVGLKILTVNDFGGAVEIEQSREEQEAITNVLNEVIEIMKEREYTERSLYLNDNKGIQMRRFVAVSKQDKECTLTIVDHHSAANSITPRRTFSEFCYSCKYYPDSEEVKHNQEKSCATGMMSLTLRADGVLSPCRLCCDKGKNIKTARRHNKMQELVDDLLKAYDKCFHKTIQVK